MRWLTVFVVTWACFGPSSAAAAPQEGAAPPPPVEVPAAEPEPEASPPPPVETPGPGDALVDEGADGDDDAPPPSKVKPKKQKADDDDDDEPEEPESDDRAFLSEPLYGALIGSGVGACLPAAGVGVAGAVLVPAVLAGTTCSEALGVLLIVSFIGLPASAALGPCAALGAATGGVCGTLLDDGDVFATLWGAAPGLVTGVASSLLILGSLGLLAQSNVPLLKDASLGNVLLVSGFAAGLLAGPVTAAGMGIVHSFNDDARDGSDDIDIPDLRGGGTEARYAPRRGGPMRF